MTTFVAFLRGINVGGHKPIKMAVLKQAFEQMGFKNVHTVLASGNIVFEALKAPGEALFFKIEQKLLKLFGYKVSVIIRETAQLEALVHKNPFKKVKVTPNTRLYITFLPEKQKGGKNIDYESPIKDFEILHISSQEICSVLTLSPTVGTTDFMNVLEKEFGKEVTTRSWNTLLKVLQLD